MNEVPERKKLSFKCRSIRSNSCQTTSKRVFRVSSPLSKPALHQPHINVHKKQPVFHIPKKILTLKNPNPTTLPLTTEYFTKINPSLTSNRSYTNQAQLQMQREIQQLQIEKLAINQQSSSEEQQGEGEENYCTHDYLSKATMKNSVKFREGKEIKLMLMELADGHQEMMAMLREIMNKEKKQGDSQSREIRNQYRGRTYSRMNKLEPHNQKPQKLKINQVYNQTINTTSPPCTTQNTMLSSSCHKKSVSPFVASMLVSVLNSNLSYYPFLNTQMGLRQLISRRFQAFYMNYNHFLQGLLEFGSQYIGKENFCQILKKVPFLLQEDQIEIIIKTLHQKTYINDTICNHPFSLSQLAQKLRYFIPNRIPLDRHKIQLKIIQFKTILTSKSSQIKQAFRRITGYSNTINFRQLENILKEYRFQEYQIQILLAKLCVGSRNINQIVYGRLFQEGWIQGLDG